MLPRPFAPGIDTSQDTRSLRGTHQARQAFSNGRIEQEASASTEDSENRNAHTSASPPPKISSSSTQSQDPQLQHRRGVLTESNHGLMTPTGLVSTSASPLPPNWFELAVKARTAALRESQRKMSAPAASTQSEVVAAQAEAAPSLGPEDAPSFQNATPQTSAAPAQATDTLPALKTEPIVESLSLPDAPPAARAETLLDQPMAGGLVSASSTDGTAPSAPDASAPTSSASAPIIAALTNTTASRSTPPDGADALRTEVMGPPPSLPADPAYPPLNPVLSDAPAPAPTNPKRRGAASAVNGAQRKAAALQAPSDYVPPSNLNGKMPYALFQTVKKTSPVPDKASAEAPGAERSNRYVHLYLFRDRRQQRLRRYAHVVRGCIGEDAARKIWRLRRWRHAATLGNAKADDAMER